MINICEKESIEGMKKILITGGPTNEPIDEVMKITNMSTGSLSTALGQLFHDAGYRVCLILNNSVSTAKLPSSRDLSVIRIENTDDMLQAIHRRSTEGDYGAVIHAAAVGDYRCDFSFFMKDLAEEIFRVKDTIESSAEILDIMKDPLCKLRKDVKISSYHEDLTVKLTLTPKIIEHLREWFPSALLIGCKLLDGVQDTELLEVARKLCVKNRMDYILANDLAKLRTGNTARYPVSTDGYEGFKLDTAKDIFDFVDDRLKTAEK